MKKKLIYGSLALSLLLGSATVSAHPGRTDSNGGHTCWTNCSKWGLSYGEYHYHNGGSSSSSSSSRSSSSTSNSSSSNKNKSKTKSKSTIPTYRESGLKVYINEKKLSFGSEPLIYQNTNLIPLREIAEGMGAMVTWDKNSGSIGVKKRKSKDDLNDWKQDCILQ